MAIEIDTSAALIQRQRQRTRFTVVSVLFSSCAKAASYESRSEASAAIVMKTQVHAANEVSLLSTQTARGITRRGHAREGEREVYAYRSIDRRGARGRRTAGNCLTLPRSRSIRLSSPSLSITRRLHSQTRHAQPTNTATQSGPLRTSLEIASALRTTAGAPQHEELTIILPSKAHHLSTIQIQSSPSLYRPNLSPSSVALLTLIDSIVSLSLPRSCRNPPSLPPTLPPSISLHLSIDHHVATLFQVPEVCEWVIALWWACSFGRREITNIE